MSRRKVASIAVAAILAAILFLLTSCAALTDPNAQRTSGMSGGDASLSENVNLREVSVELQGDATLVHLNFISGSRNAGVEESKLSAVPSYAVTQLYDPARIQVALSIGFSDYASTGTVFKDSVVEGMFDCTMEESGTRLLYLQLSSPVTVECRVSGSVLTLVLNPRSVATRTAWYVGLNAVPAFEKGQVPESLDFAPTMCDGFAATVLISRPLSSEKEAEAVREQAAEELPASVSPDALYIFSMRTNELPPYESMGSLAIASSEAVIEQDGEPKVLTVFLEDGTWLCQTESGTVYYAVPYVPQGNSDTDGAIRQELWVRTSSGEASQVMSERFYDIQQAAVSYDGRYIGILDARSDSQLLYVYDMQTGLLRNLGEEGFGDYTVSFLWLPNVNVIYAMTGTADSLQLLKYDFEVAEDSVRVQSVEERNGAESAIYYANGRIYFADQLDMTVYAVDLATGERAALGSGISCTVSPDGRKLAVLQMRMLNEMEMSFSLVLMDPATGAVTETVVEDVQVEAFSFTPDSGALICTVQSDAAGSEDFPFAVYAYTTEKGLETLGTSRTERVLVSPVPHKLYLIYLFTTGQETKTLLPVTYVWDLAEQSGDSRTESQ